MITVALTLLLSYLALSFARDSEEVRAKKWHTKYGTWPLPDMRARETEGYAKMFDDREVEIMALTGSDERWENWIQHTGARLVHNFTSLGFEVVDTPAEVHALLKEALDNGLADWDNVPEEGNIDVIFHPQELPPKFIRIGSLTEKIHELLLPYHEEWAGGIKLVPTSAYGLRVYQNLSSLVMHVDKVKTHVISSIVHIGHEYDDDENPWPLSIEGHDGKLYELNLKPGQMAFYESAKCLHGRPKEFRGRYYSSIFVHYTPEDRSLWPYTHDDIIQAVPPHWRDNVSEDYGARWAGASVTVDSRVAAGAPPRFPNYRAQRKMMERNAEL